MSLIGNKKIEKIFVGTKQVDSVFVGSNKVYSSGPALVKCEIRNLGSENPNDVTFTKTEGFPTENEAWEEVTIGNDKFAKFTPWYKKPIYNGNELIGFDIQNGPGEGFYPYDCFLDENGELLEYILIGRYCASNTSEINSVDAMGASSVISAWRSLARAKGTGYQIMDAAMQIFWRDLALAISENVNFNDGSGVPSYLGLARMNNGGWWIDGLTHVNTQFLYCNKPSKYVDSPTSSTDGYEELSYPYPTTIGYCVKKLGYDASHPTVNLPSEGVKNTAYNTYYCDAVYYSTGNLACNVNVGLLSSFASYGLFFLSTDNWNVSYGARLCYRPISA